MESPKMFMTILKSVASRKCILTFFTFRRLKLKERINFNSKMYFFSVTTMICFLDLLTLGFSEERSGSLVQMNSEMN